MLYLAATAAAPAIADGIVRGLNAVATQHTLVQEKSKPSDGVDWGNANKHNHITKGSRSLGRQHDWNKFGIDPDNDPDPWSKILPIIKYAMDHGTSVATPPATSRSNTGVQIVYDYYFENFDTWVRVIVRQFSDSTKLVDAWPH